LRPLVIVTDGFGLSGAERVTLRDPMMVVPSALITSIADGTSAAGQEEGRHQ